MDVFAFREELIALWPSKSDQCKARTEGNDGDQELPALDSVHKKASGMP